MAPNTPARPRTRRRKDGASSSSTPAASPVAWTLPTDLLLEIVARSDVSTLVRCAAACKPLRRDILSPSFIRRVTGQEGRADDDGGVVPSCLLAYVRTRTRNDDDDDDDFSPLSLVHPATPTAASFSDEHLAPFMSRSSADLLAQYELITSRGGLVVLRRRRIWCRRHERCSDLCVYDPMTGERTFLSNPPVIICEDSCIQNCNHAYVLLTAADGIGCSFMLFVANILMMGTNPDMRFQTASSDAGGTWGPVTRVSHPSFRWWWLKDRRDDAVVLRGGVIHWLLRYRDQIVTYDVGTETPGSVNLPAIYWNRVDHHCLSPSADGRLLRLLTAEGSVISVWLQQLSASGACWAPEAVIDTEAKLRSLAPEFPPGPVLIRFEYSWERSGVALLRVGRPLFVLDLKTMEIRRPRLDSPFPPLLLEVNLLARLQAMKIYS